MICKLVSLIDELHILVDGAGLEHLVEGIDVIRHGGEDLAADPPQKIPHRLIAAQIPVDRNPLDQRSDGMAHLRQGATVVHGGEGHLAAVQILAQHQGHGSLEEGAFGYMGFLTEGLYPLRGQRPRFIADIRADAGGQGAVQVARQGGHILGIPEQIQVVFPGPVVGSVPQLPFLDHGRLLDGAFLALQLLPGQRPVHFRNKLADGRSVKENQMRLDRQIASFRRPVHRGTEQPVIHHRHHGHKGLH